ncbi:YecA family protein [Burkholderia sp. LMU1-1-1.1]|uniref:YecA family protein n=1 Tax=Burkholderia sp. LMU1-1-1.1 TaxID=3135266 RepID=UPI00341CD567
MNLLNSDEGMLLLTSMQEVIKAHLNEIDVGVGVEASPEIDNLLDELISAREIYASGSDEIQNDISILETYIEFFRSYGSLWRKISSGQYSESWVALQDANDSLRLIRRWSGIALDPLAEQLCALESLYPYKIFASVGWAVGWYECSICGHDIDSFECSHRRNELYRGQRACAIARDMLAMDHVALVEHPVDKRCVITIPNNAPGFSGIKYLANALNRKHIRISNFGGVAWGKKQVPNSDYTKIGRNDLCHCRSGKKFKRCCSDKKFREINHAEILPMRSVFERSGL